MATERMQEAPVKAAGVPRRDDLRSLVGRPWVQALLVTTAVVSTVGVTATKGKEGSRAEHRYTASETAAGMDAAAGIVDESVEAAWRQRAMERESQKLSAQFVQRGYRVSPELALSIHEAALRYEIDPKTAFGLVRAESGFRNTATSPVGAVGLTQLMPRTAAWMEPGVTREQLRNPDVNLDIGFKYLRYLKDKYNGNEDLALLAYNRGPGTVDRALRRGLNPDNGYAAFVRGEANHGHTLFTSQPRAAAPKKAATATKKTAAAKKVTPKKGATAKKATPAKKAPAKRPAQRTNTKKAR